MKNQHWTLPEPRQSESEIRITQNLSLRCKRSLITISVKYLLISFIALRKLNHSKLMMLPHTYIQNLVEMHGKCTNNTKLLICNICNREQMIEYLDFGRPQNSVLETSNQIQPNEQANIYILRENHNVHREMEEHEAVIQSTFLLEICHS